ncbi:hypothetical protein BAUCODRAFT_33412 [Baudoinia panamericana UAMH 10762]|uniref:Uncharacterized protein n=1 Tax=Baudoinia panamericana (strain UAMH 10762) TaxID=717646 RepID=M2N178_BAUPA|nr:uncharacterized protein BAUCODRAFT_33412 [Baudoinia panamericana UAMH 10762]EMC97693.1 hypothetical protein BAUCODRAFT_33412 [Baudoinia panamericana UAMH 10762]
MLITFYSNPQHRGIAKNCRTRNKVHQQSRLPETCISREKLDTNPCPGVAETSTTVLQAASCETDPTPSMARVEERGARDTACLVFGRSSNATPKLPLGQWSLRRLMLVSGMYYYPARESESRFEPIW